MKQGTLVTKYSALSRERKRPKTQHYPGNLSDQILSMFQRNQVTKYPTWSRNIIILYLLIERQSFINHFPTVFLIKLSGTSTGKEQRVYQAQLVPVDRRKTFSELYLHTASKNLILSAVNWAKRAARLTAIWTSGERCVACLQAGNGLIEIVTWFVR